VPLDPLADEARLRLADGTTWSIRAADATAAVVVSRFRAAMTLGGGCAAARELVLHIQNAPGLRAERCLQRDGVMTCRVPVPWNEGLTVALMQRLGWAIASQAELSSGVLLHGALAEWEGKAVILAGPGGVGKSTASRRLPEHWVSWSDDAALVVRDAIGAYWAHPWPTWSQFVFGPPGGTWQVERALPLRAVFFLEQGACEAAERVRAAHSICALIRSTEEVAPAHLLDLTEDETRRLRLRRLDNVSGIARIIPCYRLCVTLSGAFWQEMEKALA
jgi:SynChlorMet cassette protein ScmC